MDVQVLIISQAKSLRDMCLAVAKQMGLGASDAETAPGAFDVLGNGGFDIILADVRMPDLNAFQLIKTARGASPDSDLIVLADDAAAGTAHHAVRRGVQDYLILPFEMNDLKRLPSIARSKNTTWKISRVRGTLETSRVFPLEKLSDKKGYKFTGK